jgi:hypothetical protein
MRASSDPAPTVAVVVRALLYALAVVALVLCAPGAEHDFIYHGF